jgi:hypothetical protein
LYTTARLFAKQLGAKKPAMNDSYVPRGMAPGYGRSYGRGRRWWKLPPTAGETMTVMMLVCFASFVALGVLSFVAIAVADAEGPPRFSLRSLLFTFTLAAVVSGVIAAFVRAIATT